MARGPATALTVASSIVVHGLALVGCQSTQTEGPRDDGAVTEVEAPQIGGRIYYAAGSLDDDPGVLESLDLDRSDGFGFQGMASFGTSEHPVYGVLGFETGRADSDQTAAEISYRALLVGVEGRTARSGSYLFGQIGIMHLMGELENAGGLNGDDSATGPYIAIGGAFVPEESPLGAFVAYRLLTPEPEAFGEDISSMALLVGLTFSR